MNDAIMAEIGRLQKRALCIQEREITVQSSQELNKLDDALDRLVRYAQRNFKDARVARIRSERHASEHQARRSKIVPVTSLPDADGEVPQRELTDPIPPTAWPPPRFVVDAHEQFIFTDAIERLAIPARDQRALALIAEGCTTSDLADEFELNPAAASMMKTRALRRAKPHFQAA